MSSIALRFAEHVHGHLAWLATIARYHPAIIRRRGTRQSLVVSALATGLVSVAAWLGAWLYPPYRTGVKPRLFAASSWLGTAFEREEHLAIAFVVLAWAGLIANWAAARDREERQRLRQIAFVAYAWAAGLATLTGGLGLVVSAVSSF